MAFSTADAFEKHCVEHDVEGYEPRLKYVGRHIGRCLGHRCTECDETFPGRAGLKGHRPCSKRGEDEKVEPGYRGQFVLS